ncbi:hypothetical protein RQP50_01115 [Paenibacillus sp. chi10]|uniref:Uncharacterized protein n=1 Tax=Paenibacillus suaedae TaxID=3077233 RepID=A0AAJ2JSG0_9BACL|nr:hypothetical protein [Paenibacillus sp. chi10]MDT8974839.1 hypothetical protein [Paenibacillus sp. chi10]
MTFEKELPEWKEKGVKPPQSKLDEGWKVQDKPPAAWLNWQMNKTYEALKEVQEKAAEKTDVTKTLKDAKDYTDQKVKDIDLSKITPESIGALPIAGGTVRGNLGLQGSNGALQFQSGTGDNATYETYNNAIQAHWGLAMKTYDGTVTGLWDSRMGRWVTKGGHVVQNNSGVQWSVDTNGEQSMNGNLYANKQIHAAGRVWVGKTTQFGNEASCTLTLGDTDTGLNWVGDGQFDIMSNAQAAAKVNGGQMSFRMADGSYKTANDLFQSGVNAKQGTVDALNSKSVAASTNDDWSTLNGKIRTLHGRHDGSLTMKGSAGGGGNPEAGYQYVPITTVPAGATQIILNAISTDTWSGNCITIPMTDSYSIKIRLELVDITGKAVTIAETSGSSYGIGRVYFQSITYSPNSGELYFNAGYRSNGETSGFNFGRKDVGTLNNSGAMSIRMVYFSPTQVFDYDLNMSLTTYL